MGANFQKNPVPYLDGGLFLVFIRIFRHMLLGSCEVELELAQGFIS